MQWSTEIISLLIGWLGSRILDSAVKFVRYASTKIVSHFPLVISRSTYRKLKSKIGNQSGVIAGLEKENSELKMSLACFHELAGEKLRDEVGSIEKVAFTNSVKKQIQ